MVLGTLLFVVGLLELLVPKRMVDFWMDLAVEGDDVELKSWVYTVARVEGLIIVLWLLKGSRSGSDE